MPSPAEEETNGMLAKLTEIFDGLSPEHQQQVLWLAEELARWEVTYGPPQRQVPN